MMKIGRLLGKLFKGGRVPQSGWTAERGSFTITAYDLDRLLELINSIGFDVDVPFHATLMDFSERYGLTLSLAGRRVATMDIHYIDNHFWPKEPTPAGESLLRVAMYRTWGVIVEPVIVTLEESATIPSNMLDALMSYSDSLPFHPEAKRAYEQYKAKENPLGKIAKG